MPDTFYHGSEVVELQNGARPIRSAKMSVQGIIGTAPSANTDKFPYNTPVLLLTNEDAKALGDSGTLVDAWADITDQGVKPLTVIVRVEEVADKDEQYSKIIGDATAKSGIHAFKAAQSECGVIPRILTAPGFTSERGADNANPVATALQTIAEHLRAVVICDMPAARDEALAWRQDFSSRRVYGVWPQVKVWDTTLNAYVHRPASARVAGLITKIDTEKGVWHSPSNHEILGIGGTTYPVDYIMGSPDSEANFLNSKDIATIINHNGGYRLWGNRTCATDALWAFLSVGRTTDMVYDSIEEGMMPFVDKPMLPQNVKDVVESGNAYLRRLKARGAILGGEIWLDPEQNEVTAMASGKIIFDFDFEVPAPMEHIRFRARRNLGYYEELLTL